MDKSTVCFKDEASVTGTEKWRREQDETKLLQSAGPDHWGLVVMLGFCLIYKNNEKLFKGLSWEVMRSDFAGKNHSGYSMEQRLEPGG